MEIIRDPAVIRAYIRARLLIEEEATLADNLAPTGDADTDKRYRKRYALFCMSSRDLTCPLTGWKSVLRE